jgi:hypothetical protein
VSASGYSLRFPLWWLTANPDEDVLARLQPYQNALAPATVEHGAVTAILTGVHGNETPWPQRLR